MTVFSYTHSPMVNTKAEAATSTASIVFDRILPRIHATILSMLNKKTRHDLQYTHKSRSESIHMKRKVSPGFQLLLNISH